jgi:hypothetical protein
MGNHYFETYIINGYSLASILLMLLPLMLKKQNDLFKTSQNFLSIFLIISVIVFVSIEATALFKEWYSGVEYSGYAFETNSDVIMLTLPTWYFTLLTLLIIVIPLNATKKLRQKKWVIISTILLINFPFLYNKLIILITSFHRDFATNSNALFDLRGFINQTLIPSIICLALSLGASVIKKRFLTQV